MEMIAAARIARMRLSELRFVGDIFFAAQYGAMMGVVQGMETMLKDEWG